MAPCPALGWLPSHTCKGVEQSHWRFSDLGRAGLTSLVRLKELREVCACASASPPAQLWGVVATVGFQEGLEKKPPLMAFRSSKLDGRHWAKYCAPRKAENVWGWQAAHLNAGTQVPGSQVLWQLRAGLLKRLCSQGRGGVTSSRRVA